MSAGTCRGEGCSAAAFPSMQFIFSEWAGGKIQRLVVWLKTPFCEGEPIEYRTVKVNVWSLSKHSHYGLGFFC